MEVAFFQIALIDTQGVDPEEAALIALTEVQEEGVQIGLDEEGFGIDCDALMGSGGSAGAGAAGRAPGIADGEIWWARGSGELGDAKGEGMGVG